MNQRDVEAFISSLALKNEVETGCRVFNGAKTTILRSPARMRWEWPREFGYHWEILTFENDARRIDEIVKQHVGTEEERVIDAFHPDPESIATGMGPLGYQCAWVSPIMARNLSDSWPEETKAPECDVEHVTTIQQQEDFNSLRGISNLFEGRHPRIHNFFVSAGRRVVAKGQLIAQDSSIGYISDMFTADSDRRQGYCHATMAALDAFARSLQLSRCVLAPGLLTIEMALYEKYGYAPSARRAVMIRRGS